MSRKEYEDAMNNFYDLICLKYRDKKPYTSQTVLEIVELFIIEFPKLFIVEEKIYKAAIPNIMEFIPIVIKESFSIDEVLCKLSLVALRETKLVSCLFWIKLVWWQKKYHSNK